MRELTAHDVRGALTALGKDRSTATVAIAHNALTRAFRHAEARDLVRRNVSALRAAQRRRCRRAPAGRSQDRAALARRPRPYPRYRWVLTGLLDADEGDLRPEVRAAIAARSRPAEIKAVYPSRHAVPRAAWQSLFGSAEREIGVLACSGLFLAAEPGVLDVLADRARDGLRVRICLRDPDEPVTVERRAGEGASGIATAGMREALGLFGQLADCDGAEIRLHRAVLYNSIYQADDQLLVSQHAYGIPGERAPVLYLRPADDGDLAATYLDAFERIWAGALPLE